MFDGGGVKRCREVPFQVTFQMTTLSLMSLIFLRYVLGLVLYTGNWISCYAEKKGLRTCNAYYTATGHM
jgi:hypothetical protein